ncbi:MAG TPA: peptidyl-prolyl cis-trans isomerase [Chthoniobacteraceae bacterium]|jgi:hypothetical protein|nr:peptidyl-prolyl cis-trans isomerase [Chthoniobacteraceae bacterium]
MVNLFRKHQQGVLIGVTIVVIATFVWYWNGSRVGGAGFAGASRAATIYGHSVTDLDLQRLGRKFAVARMLGMDELLQSLVGAAQNQEQALENYVWNSYVFDHEADALQIFPTQEQMEDELQKIPGLQTDGKFDPAKLSAIVQDRLPAFGFTDSIIDELVRDAVRVRQTSDLIGSTVTITPSEAANRYDEQNEKMTITVMRLDVSSVMKGIAVSDADAQKVYDQNKGAYHTDEQRKVQVASFDLTPEQQKLEGRERTAALQALGDKAWNFARTVVDKGSNFTGEAKKAGAALADSSLFSEAQPDPAFSKIPTLAQNAFKLTPDLPNSDVIEGINGYYVLHLEQTAPGVQLTFEQAKPKVIGQIQSERAGQMMPTIASQARTKLLDALKAGKPIDDAAKAAGLAAEDVQPFTLLDISRMDVPDLQTVVQTAITLGSKQLSDFAPTANGGLFVYMDSRQTPDEATTGLGVAMEQNEFNRQKKLAAFFEWLRIQREAARLEIVQR